jgi:SAM-dependent methyltransferase
MFENFTSTDCLNCGAGPAQSWPVVTTRVTHESHLYGKPIRVVSCRDCGLVYVNPRPPRSSIAKLYGDELYQQPKGTIVPRKGTRKLSIGDLHSVLNEQIGEPLQGKRILDIGANEGRWLALFDRTNTLVGIEPSAAALRPFRRDITLIRSDLESAAVSGGFDLVTATALIEHLYDPLDGLVRMNAFLEEGGRLFLYTPDIKGLALRRGVSKYFKIVHLYYFSVATLSSLLNKSGFVVESSRVFPPYFSHPFVFPQTSSPGAFCVLARKVASIGYENAVRQPPATGPEEYRVATDVIRSAIRRDMVVGKVSTVLNQTRRMRNKASGALKAKYPRAWSQLRSVVNSSARRR